MWRNEEGEEDGENEADKDDLVIKVIVIKVNIVKEVKSSDRLVFFGTQSEIRGLGWDFPQNFKVSLMYLRYAQDMLKIFPRNAQDY